MEIRSSPLSIPGGLGAHSRLNSTPQGSFTVSSLSKSGFPAALTAKQLFSRLKYDPTIAADDWQVRVAAADGGSESATRTRGGRASDAEVQCCCFGDFFGDRAPSPKRTLDCMQSSAFHSPTNVTRKNHPNRYGRWVICKARNDAAALRRGECGLKRA